MSEEHQEQQEQLQEQQEAEIQTNIHVFTLAEAAKILKISDRTLRGYLQAGKLKGAKVGAAWRILEENLREFIENGADIIEGNRRADKQGTPLVAHGIHLPHRGNNGGGRRRKSRPDTAGEAS